MWPRPRTARKRNSTTSTQGSRVGPRSTTVSRYTTADVPFAKCSRRPTHVQAGLHGAAPSREQGAGDGHTAGDRRRRRHDAPRRTLLGEHREGPHRRTSRTAAPHAPGPAGPVPLAGVAEVEDLGLGDDRDPRRQLEELGDVHPGDVGDAAHLALPPQQLVGELRNAVEVDGVDGHDAGPAEGAQRADDDVTGGGEGDGGVELDGGAVSWSGPAQRAPSSRRPALLRGGSGADVHLATPVPRHLDRAGRRGAEAVEAELLAAAHAGHPQRAVANGATAQQRRRRDGRDSLRQVVDEVGAGRRTARREPPSRSQPVNVASSQRFSRPAGRPAAPARPRDPRHAHPVAELHAGARRGGGNRQRGPSSTTRPTAWWPGTTGSCARPGRPRTAAGRSGTPRRPRPRRAPRRDRGRGVGRRRQRSGRPGRRRRLQQPGAALGATGPPRGLSVDALEARSRARHDNGAPGDRPGCSAS